jgi:hypothetical protein
MPYRVRDKHKADPCAFYSPAAGGHIVPDPTRQYADDDPLVQAAPWYFVREGEQEPPPPDSVRVDAPIEQATANPGEKRSTRRPR